MSLGPDDRLTDPTAPASPDAASGSCIVAFREDEHGDWIARLDCGHERHVRHDPPWSNRPWVTDAAGRKAAIGQSLHCGHCTKELE